MICLLGDSSTEAVAATGFACRYSEDARHRVCLWLSCMRQPGLPLTACDAEIIRIGQLVKMCFRLFFI